MIPDINIGFGFSDEQEYVSNPEKRCSTDSRLDFICRVRDEKARDLTACFCIPSSYYFKAFLFLCRHPDYSSEIVRDMMVETWLKNHNLKYACVKVIGIKDNEGRIIPL